MKTKEEILEDALHRHHIEGLVEEGGRIWNAALEAMEEYRNQPPIPREELMERFSEWWGSPMTERMVFDWFWENMPTGVDARSLLNDFTPLVYEWLLNPPFKLEHAHHAIACEKFQEIRNKFLDSMEAIKHLSNIPASKPTIDAADVRNKLGPFENLLAMIDGGMLRPNGKLSLIESEVNQCRASLDYLSNLPEKPEWIPCGERLPEHTNDVWCYESYTGRQFTARRYTMNGRQFVGHRNKGDRAGDYEAQETITHWRELPQPPKPKD